ncbi:uncharacterized protein LY89DRAFT_726897 [Mollisia scopiformis]|uniref:NACHT domain-containing protein n=1 Tax=Mollisia scopiformis TaxID=149040 RepID=A0A194XVU9_MOLSC|nr:uncharacterized protein LY89DRAFT_726897 [Mollisia scopiformis]KUJ23842.1 hypothetical protein LY89DRAFT_726897 [Mollisia scopiformis]
MTRSHFSAIIPKDYERLLDKVRIEDRKGGLLRDSYRWVLDNSEFQRWRNGKHSQLLWIKGDPGKGKTMLLCGIIDELSQSTKLAGHVDGALLSYFFCQAADSRINSATAVLRGLIYLLADQQPSFIPHIRKKYDHAGKQLFEDVNAWVALLEILTNILQDPNLQSTYLVIDALNECVTDLPLLLDFVVRISSISSRVKWIVSSRNWPNIEEHLETATQKIRICLELNEKSISMAVGIYIRYKVDELSQEKKYDDTTRNAVQRYLCSNANDTFLWVALVCQSLSRISRLNTMANLAAFPLGLESVYKRMVQNIYTSENADLCKRVLSVVATAYRPLFLDELKSFIDLPEGVPGDLAAWGQIIGFCGSLLTLRENAVYFVHQSAKEFLLSQTSDAIFPSREHNMHHTLFSRSLLVMSRTLRRDIYSIRAPGLPIYKVKQPHPDPLAGVSYSCFYWVDHLCAARSLETDSRFSTLTERDINAVHTFLSEKFLYWVEALSLSRNISSLVVAIAKLEQFSTQPGISSQHLALVHDMSRFILHFRSAIENYPLQISSSALIFSPTQSLIRQLFWRDEPEWITIKPIMESQWNELLQTLEGHRGSADGTIKLWDTKTRALLQTFKGHTAWVWSVAFSPNSQRLASSSYDHTVRLWDINLGTLQQTLKGHEDSVRTVTFSPNSQQLVSLSSDGNIRLWDANSGVLLQTLGGHKDSVTSVVFSPDGCQLASWSYDRTVRLWDSNSGALKQTLKGHKDWVWSVAFSPDSQWLASSSFDGVLRLWDANTGVLKHTLEGHRDWVWSVAFSPDGQQLVSSSSDGLLRLWDTNSGILLQAFDGHKDWVFSVVFSPDGKRLASGSADKTVRFWDTFSGALLQTLTGHTGWVRSVAFSPDGQWLVSSSADGTVRLWTNSGILMRTLKGHRNSLKSVVFSPDDQRLTSLSADGTVKHWDTNTGALQQACPAVSTPCLSCISDSKLVTERGAVNLDNISESENTEGPESFNSESVGCGFSNDRSWVTWDGENVLWLPPEYRPTASTTSAIAKQKVAIGCSLGRVLLFGFSADVGTQ